jgi:hypothetical protein
MLTTWFVTNFIINSFRAIIDDVRLANTLHLIIVCVFGVTMGRRCYLSLGSKELTGPRTLINTCITVTTQVPVLVEDLCL